MAAALNDFSGVLINDESERLIGGSDGHVAILKLSLEMNLHLQIKSRQLDKGLTPWTGSETKEICSRGSDFIGKQKLLRLRASQWI